VYIAAFVLIVRPHKCASPSLATMASPPLAAAMASRLLRSLPSASSVLVPSRGLKIPKSPAKFDIKNMPAKHRLPIMPRTPVLFANAGIKIPKGQKDLYRIQGEELVHSKLVLGQFGIVAVSGGQMKYQHFDVLRMEIGRYLKAGKSFGIWRVDPPFKPVTVHGSGRKLGGGKGSISHYVTPVKAGRVIVEVGGKVLWEEIRPVLNFIAAKLPFDAMAVSQDQMESLDAEEERLEETNENPYTFEWLVRNNIFDCHTYTSPRDRLWFGKFIYRDRTFNKKWNSVLRTKYKRR